jgi:hypothetical protein
MSHFAVYSKGSRTFVGEVHPTREAAEAAVERLLDGFPSGPAGAAQREHAEYVVIRLPGKG